MRQCTVNWNINGYLKCPVLFLYGLKLSYAEENYLNLEKMQSICVNFCL